MSIAASCNPSCPWFNNTWTEIRDEVNTLLTSVEVTIRCRAFPVEVLGKIRDKKTALETAIRRRFRTVDEVWHCFTSLRLAHSDLLNGNLIVGRVVSFVGLDSVGRSSTNFIIPGSSASFSSPSGSNSTVFIDAIPKDGKSCFDMISQTLIKCGVELDLYDEESQDITRVAGVGLGLALFVAICTVVYYF